MEKTRQLAKLWKQLSEYLCCGLLLGDQGLFLWNMSGSTSLLNAYLDEEGI
jgi:hypothetical protein